MGGKFNFELNAFDPEESKNHAMVEKERGRRIIESRDKSTIRSTVSSKKFPSERDNFPTVLRPKHPKLDRII